VYARYQGSGPDVPPDGLDQPPRDGTVPIPGSLPLAALGFGLLALSRRRA
jgi:MYXO-CTERM domain-containing protein